MKQQRCCVLPNVMACTQPEMMAFLSTFERGISHAESRRQSIEHVYGSHKDLINQLGLMEATLDM
ncbi:hypothetical protein OUZ56_002402 [Daphnia magna]|uniref:Uncharacterized protein n=1 Tax=Daphnia magna TaxID=35525 RepID=A0ABR0A610_9CRUS|nr:hypothetical protein OUZ56_002402 [Daphnia magna]